MRSGSSPALSARRRRMRKTPARVSGPPCALRNSSCRWRRSRYGTTVREVATEGVRCLAPDRHDPFLASLAEGANEPVLEIDGLTVEPDRFAHAQPGAVEELAERAVAEVSRRRPRGGVEQALDLRGRERARQRPPALRQLDVRRRVVGPRAPSSTWCRKKERTAASRRATVVGGEAVRAKLRDVGGEVVRARVRRRAAEPRGQVARSRRYASTVRGARRAEERARKPSTAGSGFSVTRADFGPGLDDACSNGGVERTRIVVLRLRAGCRISLRRRASRRVPARCRGWVRNRPDGAVEAVFEGRDRGRRRARRLLSPRAARRRRRARGRRGRGYLRA